MKMIISKTNISVSRVSIEEMVKELDISWVNQRITDLDYPFKDSFLGEWEVEVVRPSKKMRFEEIVDLSRQEGYEPATIFHLLFFLKTINNIENYKVLMAPASLCLDDFEHPGCVVLGKYQEGLKLGVGNWRGFKIGGHDILRTKKISS